MVGIDNVLTIDILTIALTHEVDVAYLYKT